MRENEKIELSDEDIRAYVGQRLKMRRMIMAMTQRHLADKCNLTFQQIQKYESGETNINILRLYHMGNVLDMPMSFVFSGLPNQTPASDTLSFARANEFRMKSPDPGDPLSKNESLELVRMYWDLPSDSARAHVMGLMRTLVGGNE